MERLNVAIRLGDDKKQEVVEEPEVPTSPTHSKGKSKKSIVKKRKPRKKYKQVELNAMAWAEHVRRVNELCKNAVAEVDDRAPRLLLSQLHNAGRIKLEEAHIRNYEKRLKNIIFSVNWLDRFGGETDTLAPPINICPMPTNYAVRKRAARKLEVANMYISRSLAGMETTMKTVKEYAQDWARIETYMAGCSQYPLWWKVKKKKVERIEVAPPPAHFVQYVTEKSSKYCDKRPRVFFEISIPTVGVVGKMVAVLFSDYVPKTVKNFLAFCNPKAKLTYKGNRFYLIFQKYFCQTGDVVENMGFGGTSIYGPYFGDEDHTLQHGERGVLTMFNKKPNRNHCQFLITFRRLNTMDGQNVVFGKLIKGFNVLDAIESVGSKKTGRPQCGIYISDCDEI